MMEARLDDAERLSELALEIGTEIGEPGQRSRSTPASFFANRSFAGRYAPSSPLVEGIMEGAPGYLPVPARLRDHVPGR